MASGWVTQELLSQLIARPDPTILEVGANDGEHTAWFLAQFENPTIVCFEPDPRAAARFQLRLGDRAKVTLVNCAVCESDGEATFNQSSGDPGDGRPEEWDYSGSLREPRKHLEVFPWVKFESQIKVSTRSLDSWCREHGLSRVDLIWIDVQGAELDVLRGARSVLPQTRFVFAEYNNSELYAGQPDLRTLLTYMRGFRVLLRYRDDVLLVNEELNESDV